MHIERRITFVVEEGGFASWQLNRLKILSGYFRSVVVLHNITSGSKANTEHVLKVMSLGIQPNQLCQLWIEGSDAELACMVLTDFIADKFEIVNTAHKPSEIRCNLMIENHCAFHLPFNVDYYFESLQSNLTINKSILITKLAKCVNSVQTDAIDHALLTREAISSTGIGHGVALPHIMIEEIEIPSLVIFKLDNSIDWASKQGAVNLIIGIFIPAKSTKAMIHACTKLSRALLSTDNCHLLTTTRQPEVIKAIIFHFMSRDWHN